MNPIFQMLMNQLQSFNPQGYQFINQMMIGGANPQNIIKQMIGNSNNNDMQGILKKAKQLGVPDNILSQIQNMK